MFILPIYQANVYTLFNLDSLKKVIKYTVLSQILKQRREELECLIKYIMPMIHHLPTLIKDRLIKSFFYIAKIDKTLFWIDVFSYINIFLYMSKW